MTSDSTVPNAIRVGRVALRVNDRDRVAGFYESVVGLSIHRRTENRTVLGAGDEDLLELVGAPEAPERTRTETGLFHVAFLVPSRTALGNALERVERQWELSGASDHRVSEALYFSDPEGNGVEVYCDRPRTEWPVDDGNVQMATLPLDTGELRDLSQNTQTVPEGTVVGHVHLEVASLSQSREFYADALGLRVRQRIGSSALFLAADDYHHHVGLNTWSGRSSPPGGHGLAWFELVVPTDAALDGIRERFETRRATTTPTDDGGFEVADPDGIRLRVRAEN